MKSNQRISTTIIDVVDHKSSNKIAQKTAQEHRYCHTQIKKNWWRKLL